MSTQSEIDPDDGSHEEIIDELAELREQVDDPEAREQVNDLMEQVAELQRPGLGNAIVGFDRTDLAEATLGALIFGIPMFVEGGTAEAGEFIAARPLYLVGTIVATVAIVYGLVYVAEFQDVRVHEPLLGLVPRRLVGVLGVSALVALLGLTVWGRIDWSRPWLAVCSVAVATLPMSIGAALGDILPGS
ncbi:DUF2391 family protein [Halosegnis sp.]|uniref:DUF2391 family protein n=1 Tax=Halosegnis sp. TaxID=2864959 RepID=UPI0035D4FA8E